MRTTKELNKNDLPGKAKFVKDLDDKDLIFRIGCEENDFQDVSYRKEKWLACTFGTKDDADYEKHLSYFTIKSQNCAYSSAIYDIFNTSPKYRSLYHEVNNAYQLLGFMTKKVENFIRLDHVFGFINFLRLDELCIFPIVPRQFTMNRYDNFFTFSSLTLDEWTDEKVKYIEDVFSLCKGIMNESALRKLKNDLIHFLTTLNVKLFLTLVKQKEKNKLDNKFEIEKEIDQLFNEFTDTFRQFYQNKIQPIRLNLIEEYKKILLNNGLPSIMAVAYFIGEWSFKSADILIKTDNYQILKIDHERTLWKTSHDVLTELGLNKCFDTPENIVLQGHISAKGIDIFPDRENPPRFWPSKNDDYNYPQWFLDLIHHPDFIKKSYATFLTLILLPDKVFTKFANDMFFDADNKEKNTMAVLDRKKMLTDALNESSKFKEFLLQEKCEEDVLKILSRHNHTWQKDKYRDLQVDIKKAMTSISNLKREWQREDDTDSAMTHISTPPPMRNRGC